jgi:hypothetical protein
MLARRLWWPHTVPKSCSLSRPISGVHEPPFCLINHDCLRTLQGPQGGPVSEHFEGLQANSRPCQEVSPNHFVLCGHLRIDLLALPEPISP